MRNNFPQTDNPQVVYYAFGGGMGHVIRAAALLRQLTRLGFENLLVFTDALSPQPLKQEKIRFLYFEDSSAADFQTQIQRAMRQLHPDLIIVDTFPHGLFNELDDVLREQSCRKIYLYQHLKDVYQRPIEKAMHFDEALIAEEPAAPLPFPTTICSPMLIRDAKELLPRKAARKICGVTDDEPLALAVGTGSVSWEADLFTRVQRSWSSLHPNAHLRLASRHQNFPNVMAINHYPVFELFNGADIIIGAGGYNLFHETQASGAQGIFIPQQSPYDDQETRVHGACVAGSPDALTQAIKDALQQCHEITRQRAAFTNGAATAAALIAERLRTPIHS